MQELQPGQTFAGHRIDAVGGRGGMGIVYRATHLALNRTVALKVISPALAADPDFRARFEREAQLAASIDHENVIDIHDADESDGLLFITMRWVDGTDLNSLIELHGRLEPDYVVAVLREIADAMDAAHAAGLVHRDIKPANILVARNGHVYLTDFGLTRQAGKGGLTSSGMFVGTADYAAPEQITGAALDARTDVYALGCVLVEAVTGKVPFDRDSEMSRMWAHVNDAPPKLTDRVEGLPDALDDVAHRALAKEPADRYPSAGDLARAATAAVEQRVVAEPERTVATGAAAPAEDIRDAETVIRSDPQATPPSGFPAVAPAPPGGGGPPSPPPRTMPSPPPLGGGPPSPAAGPMPSPASPAPSPPPPAVPSPDAKGPPPSPPPGATPSPPSGGRRRGLVAGIAAGVALLIVVGVVAIFVLAGGDDTPDPPPGNPAGTVTGTPIKVGRNPQDVAFANGFAWVSNRNDGTLTKIDLRSLATKTIKTEGEPLAGAPGAGSIWAWIYSDAIVRVDVRTDKVSPLVRIGGGTISGVAFGEGAFWAAQGRKDQVSRVDPETNKVTTRIEVKGNPTNIDTGDGYVWVTTDKGLVQIDPKTNTVFNTIEAGKDLGGVDVKEGVVYVATGNANITRVDATSGAIAEPIPVSRAAAYFAVGEGSLWVDYPVDDVVRRISLSTRKQVGRDIKVRFDPQGMVFGEGLLWVLATRAGRVARINP